MHEGAGVADLGLFKKKKRAAPAAPAAPAPAALTPAGEGEAGTAPKFSAAQGPFGLPKAIAPYVIVGGSVLVLAILAFFMLKD